MRAATMPRRAPGSSTLVTGGLTMAHMAESIMLAMASCSGTATRESFAALSAPNACVSLNVKMARSSASGISSMRWVAI